MASKPFCLARLELKMSGMSKQHLLKAAFR
jgi:hypothetical protein